MTFTSLKSRDLALPFLLLTVQLSLHSHAHSNAIELEDVIQSKIDS